MMMIFLEFPRSLLHSPFPSVISDLPKQQQDPVSPVVSYSSYQPKPIILFPTMSLKTHCQLFLQLHGQRKAIVVVVMEVDETLMKSRRRR